MVDRQETRSNPTTIAVGHLRMATPFLAAPSFNRRRDTPREDTFRHFLRAGSKRASVFRSPRCAFSQVPGGLVPSLALNCSSEPTKKPSPFRRLGPMHPRSRRRHPRKSRAGHAWFHRWTHPHGRCRTDGSKLASPLAITRGNWTRRGFGPPENLDSPPGPGAPEDSMVTHPANPSGTSTRTSLGRQRHASKRQATSTMCLTATLIGHACRATTAIEFRDQATRREVRFASREVRRP